MIIVWLFAGLTVLSLGVALYAESKDRGWTCAGSLVLSFCSFFTTMGFAVYAISEGLA